MRFILLLAILSMTLGCEMLGVVELDGKITPEERDAYQGIAVEGCRVTLIAHNMRVESGDYEAFLATFESPNKRDLYEMSVMYEMGRCQRKIAAWDASHPVLAPPGPP